MVECEINCSRTLFVHDYRRRGIRIVNIVNQVGSTIAVIKSNASPLTNSSRGSECPVITGRFGGYGYETIFVAIFPINGCRVTPLTTVGTCNLSTFKRLTSLTVLFHQAPYLKGFEIGVVDVSGSCRFVYETAKLDSLTVTGYIHSLIIAATCQHCGGSNSHKKKIFFHVAKFF